MLSLLRFITSGIICLTYPSVKEKPFFNYFSVVVKRNIWKTYQRLKLFFVHEVEFAHKIIEVLVASVNMGLLKVPLFHHIRLTAKIRLLISRCHLIEQLTTEAIIC